MNNFEFTRYKKENWIKIKKRGALKHSHFSVPLLWWTITLYGKLKKMQEKMTGIQVILRLLKIRIFIELIIWLNERIVKGLL